MLLRIKVPTKQGNDKFNCKKTTYLSFEQYNVRKLAFTKGNFSTWIRSRIMCTGPDLRGKAIANPVLKH
jgi:hypothetical protein